MNSSLLQKIAIAAVIGALCVAIIVLIVRVASDDSEIIILNDAERAVVLSATLPGVADTLSAKERTTIENTKAPSGTKPVTLSSDDRRALMQVTEE